MVQEYKHPVIFTGENPGLTLYAPDGGGIAVAASYWHCTYSAHGEGNALIIWGSAPGDDPWRAIYADNAALGRFVTDTLTQHFGEFKERGFAAVAIQPARFAQEGDSRRYHRVVCRGENRAIELVWREVLDRRLLQASGMALGGRSFDLSTVICPCGAASVTIDERPVAGEVRTTTAEDGRVGSSAFLAFAEAWVERAGDGGQ